MPETKSPRFSFREVLRKSKRSKSAKDAEKTAAIGPPSQESLGDLVTSDASNSHSLLEVPNSIPSSSGVREFLLVHTTFILTYTILA